MKLLLDENLPKRLKQDFQEHEIYTVQTKVGHEFLMENYWGC
jgi:predicted nuclease of predicted toxin-antitoxin system